MSSWLITKVLQNCYKTIIPYNGINGRRERLEKEEEVSDGPQTCRQYPNTGAKTAKTRINFTQTRDNKSGGDSMTYISPGVQEKFETLSIDLKNAILERNEKIEDIHDLIRVLEDIVKEGEK